MGTYREVLQRHISAFALALQFLTILPVKKSSMGSDSELGLSFQYYPIVGMLVGCILLTTIYLGGSLFPANLTAVLVVATWVLLTGALHIDGLADCADAWVGGFGSRARSLELMKDPRCGPVAVAAVVIVLLIKVVALGEIILNGKFILLPWILLLARMSALALFLTTPYVRTGGIGETINRTFSRKAAISLCVSLLLLLLLVTPFSGTLLLIVLSSTLWMLRKIMLSRLGGCTGDTLGASVELLETAGLLVLAASWAEV